MTFEIDNIELNFGSKNILRGVYLKSEAGKITGILGANGTGKSSLLKIFFGCLQPHHKLVRIDQSPTLKPLFTTGMVKYLPQHSLIPQHLKLKKIFKLYKVDWKLFTESFENFRKYADHKIHELSGGEIRVAEIYLSLKSPSRLVLLDEPFSHVAPIYIEKLKEIIISEKQHKAIVMTDHLYRHIIEMADDLYLLKNGCSNLIIDPKELENHKYLSPNTL